MLRKSFLFFAPACSFFFALAAKADNINVSIPGVNIATGGPTGLVVGLYNLGLMVGGVLAFGAIVYGGIVWSLAGGNSSKVSEGRSWITGAILGLLLLLGAYLILNTINPALTNLSIPAIKQLQIPPATGPSSPSGPTCSTMTCKTGSHCTMVSGIPNCVANP